MEKNYTSRGFCRYEFDDAYDKSCSLQQSSCVEPHIWLGCNDIGLKAGMPWREISEEELKQAFNCKELVSNTRMHLNVEQVKQLIPILQKFVDTGDIG